MIKALVIKSSKRVFECKILKSKEKILATALATLLKENHIVVGDIVEIENEQIINVLPRKNEIFRIIPREAKKKVIASNCDLMAIIMSVSRPLYKRGIVDRYLMRSHQLQIPAILIFNKMDECDFSIDIDFEARRVKHLGVETFRVSAIEKNKYEDFEKLADYLKNKTSIFVGQSGTGKSKLISAITNNQIILKSQSIGKKSGKGTHTTTWAEIIDLGEYTLIDSPGVRSFSLDDVLQDDLLSFFPDLAEIATQCKFTNCKHDENSRDCAFSKIDDKLILSRLESYKKFLDEISIRPVWEKTK